MINLALQIKLIIFSFIFGFILSFVIDIFNPLIKKQKKTLQILFSFIMITVMSFIYFIGIKHIGNAIFHIYSIISIIIGFITYDLVIKLIANNTKK